MAIVHIQETPADGMETYDQVNEKLGVDDNPPEGLIVHTAGMSGSNMVIVDVWESQDAFDRFTEERLMPVIREVMGGDPPEGMAQTRTHEVHHLVKP